MKFCRIPLLVLFIFVVNSCATSKAQYAEEVEIMEVDEEISASKTFYLLGDVGKSPIGGMSDGLTIFKKHIETKKTEGDYTIFLGDNIYPAGMPKGDHKNRASAENALDAQIMSVSNFKGKTIFIPGNHDWYSNGLKGLSREEAYLEDALGKHTLLPEKGCPLESIDVSQDIQLIVLDTEWYLENWNKHPTINDKCEIKTRDRFFAELEGEIKKAQGKKVVLAMHHPMYTNGIHGGKYAWEKHLFPLSSKVPLPGIGSFVAQVRSQGGVSMQDRFNERYNELMLRIETIIFNRENVVLVSGHEHTLQYVEKGNVKQVVSGSGAKSSYATLGSNGLFSSGEQGFAELVFYKDGSARVNYFGENENDNQPKLIYTKEVFKPQLDYDVTSLPTSFPKNIEVSVYSTDETDVSRVAEKILGDHYREAYSTPITAKVATLDTLYGGLEVIRKGGGNQTKSLRLRTKDGKQFNMRALRKSATQFLQTTLYKDKYIQDDFQRTSVESFILDFYTSAHPYAFATVPDLSEAAEVFHTNPRLYYVPKHKELGVFNNEYGNELYLIEERPEKNYAGTALFDFADDIESTHDVIQKIRKDEKYKIDEDAFIRARLFDMLIGDWDRHQDQWRWAQFNHENGDKYYKPIPRDRDQVYSNFDGVLLDVLRNLSGTTRELQEYDEELKDVERMNTDGIKLDRILIQKATKAQWIEHAKFLQENITDEVIEKAFSKIPLEVQDQDIADIKKKLRGRRANMIDIAERYYEIVNKLVILTSTDKDDFIEISRDGSKQTHVKISRIKNGEKAEVILDRTFNKDVTKEIWIYGLDDKDVFEVTGKADKPIFIRIIGGQNNDTYKVSSGRAIKIYDHQSKKNTVLENKGVNINFTDVYNLNLFDFTKNIMTSTTISPAIGFNPDDGVSVGASIVRTKNGFQRNPFSNQHKFRGGYFFATKGFALKYDGEFANVFKTWNFQVGGLFTTENFANNFFGFGNETINIDDDLGLDYNRVKQSIRSINFGVVRRGNYGSDLSFKALLDGIQVGDTEGRFITDVVPPSNTDFYKRRYFGGIEALFNYTSYDDRLNPTRGMNFMFNLGGKTEFENTEYTYGYINSDIGFYNAISKNRRLVLKTDLRTQWRFGNDLVFYQAANIGGNNGLRGYRTERFTGKNALVGSADLRFSFPSFRTSFIPFQIGVFAGGDVGRVWLSGESSNTWHNDYGGGFWVTAAEKISGTFNLFNSVEGLRFSFGFSLNL
ncbi:metallophosphoesterase [Cognatitamlana onchidii]|uniref:metallophosphoesterase n=1 Tax=Cognatitamlana onchidii TaxID=2562860 RepID=UPI0010A68693|nr:metallophosphoesterase [Algibacter onchidii]